MGAGLLALAASVMPLLIHGSGDAADPAVVAIVDSTGVTACSGTLIDPHFVLTAGHCIVPQIAHGARIVIGSTVDMPTASVPVAGSRVHPAFDPSTLAHDAAILVLAEAAPVTPVPLASSAPDVGSVVQIVGWGETMVGAMDYGTKSSGAAQVTRIDPITFTVAPDPSQPCKGDSGGPALSSGLVVGITSHGNATCVGGATYTRVDTVTADFIAPTLAELGSSTVPAGARCMFSEQCIGAAAPCVAAVDGPDVTYCTRGCAVNADCPARMLCVVIGDDGSQCRYPVPTPGALGAWCRSYTDCVDGNCSPGGICAERCVPTAPACPGDSVCEAQGGGIDFYCTVPGAAAATGSSCTLAPAARSQESLLGRVALALVLLISARRTRARNACPSRARTPEAPPRDETSPALALLVRSARRPTRLRARAATRP